MHMLMLQRDIQSLTLHALLCTHHSTHVSILISQAQSSMKSVQEETKKQRYNITIYHGCLLHSSATAVPPIFGNPVLDGNIIKLSWDHTDKGPCYNHLAFFYNITWYPADEQRESATSSVDATEYVITVSPKYQFQVMILGLLASHPPVYTSPVDMRIETKGTSHNTTDCIYFYSAH